MTDSTTSQPPLLIGDTAPDFEASSTDGPLSFYQWLGDAWCIFFSHPKDFTPVCTTELGAAAKLMTEFVRRDVKVLALSVNSLESHAEWMKDIEETQHAIINFPIIGDSEGKIARMYGMIHPKASDTYTVRTVFIIDPMKKVRATLCYPASTGRSFNEILRMIDSIQLTDSHKVATPANWEWGDDCVILPTLTDPEELKRRFPRGYRQLKPYLRLTPQPK